MDIDDHTAYSAIRQIQLNKNSGLTILTNPTTNGVISYKLQGLADNTGLSISITNTTGQLITSLFMNDVKNNTTYAVGVEEQGIFFMHVTLTDGQRFVKKIVVDQIIRLIFLYKKELISQKEQLKPTLAKNPLYLVDTLN